MRYRSLGTSGLAVSVVGLGANNFGSRLGLDETRAVIDAAIEVGITLIDTADVYGNRGGSEELLGEVLHGRRDEVVLATKFGSDMGGANGADHGARASRRYVRRAVEGSLRRLRTDYIDLYQLHRPDGVTPLGETVAALDELVTEGKIRYAGSSNFAGWQIADADWVAMTGHRERFISAQNHYSWLERGIEADVIPACVAHGVGMLPFFPLANGLLTGKWRRGEEPPAGSRLAQPRARAAATPRVFDVVEALERFASERGISILDVAVGGLVAKPAVASVIAGATRPEQVTANAAAGAWVPTAAELEELDRLTSGDGGSEAG
jgi:aryl-alcohol dehydrogenase-like predicted oxidoreductase